MDKLASMQVFVEIVERGSLTAAAAAVGKSPPSIVRILASLEEALQVRLLNRTTRRIALTEEGRLYLEQCKRILADVEEAERALTQRQAEPSGTVTVKLESLNGAEAPLAYLAIPPSLFETVVLGLERRSSWQQWW